MIPALQLIMFAIQLAEDHTRRLIVRRLLDHDLIGDQI